MPARAAKNLRLLNHHHFTQVIIFCVLQNSNGLFKGSLKKSALTDWKGHVGGQDTLFLLHFYQDFYDTWKMHPKLDVKHHLTFWSHTKMDINKKLVHWAGTNKWKFTICETTGSKFNDFHHCGHESNIKNILVRCEQAVMCMSYILTYFFMNVLYKIAYLGMMIFNGFLVFLPPGLALLCNFWGSDWMTR